MCPRSCALKWMAGGEELEFLNSFAFRYLKVDLPETDQVKGFMNRLGELPFILWIRDGKVHLLLCLPPLKKADNY